jgi:cell division transport system permease protein
MTRPHHPQDEPRARAPIQAFGHPGRLVPSEGGAERSLAAVIAILTFLAALVAGAAEIGLTTAASWQQALGREATIQVRPAPGRDLEADTERGAAIARATPGILSVRKVPAAEAARLLEPWLGTGADLSDLPVPRLVALALDPGRRPDLLGLAERLRAAVPPATLDTHQAWMERLSRVAVAGGALAAAIVGLVLLASAGATAFATRGVLAGHREVVEVLHLAGAEDRFVARLFARRFARLGLGGAVAGATAAGLLMLALGSLPARFGPDNDGIQGLFGAVSLGWRGYGAIAAVMLLQGVVAGQVAAAAVKRFLKATS